MIFECLVLQLKLILYELGDIYVGYTLSKYYTFWIFKDVFFTKLSYCYPFKPCCNRSNKLQQKFLIGV